ncbi:MAG: hypothetical protein IE909_00945 [Campylobacterales bacterium]|nr:hypothetical protein [Campylobacterales bacterium]
MKKLSNISNQIKNNTFSYTGKGSFEAVAIKHKENIIKWLENLIPLQEQIDNLEELEGVQIQKRNYIRILSKIVPDFYKEFVSVNILVRDASTIAQYYEEDYNLSQIYNKLILNRYLKYPGRYEKFVEFEYFQKFVMIYRDDLIASVNSSTTFSNQNVDIIQDIEPQEQIQNLDEKNIEIVEPVSKPQPTKETNWTNLLLGKLR